MLSGKHVGDCDPHTKEGQLFVERWMRDRTLIGLGAAITVASYLLVERSQTNGIIGYFSDHLSTLKFTQWLIGFITTNIAPSACTVSFWLLARKIRYGWILHFALIPVVYGSLRLSASLMLSATGEPELESLSGHAILPSTVLMTICIAAYFGALLYSRICELKKPGKPL